MSDTYENDKARADGEPVTAEAAPKEGEPKAPSSNREAVQGFILTRGGFLAAHDTESIDTMLTGMGLNPEAAPGPVGKEVGSGKAEGGRRNHH